MTLTVVWLFFAASGAAALIYEIVWQQLLQLVIGSSTVSLGVLLGMFMGGMCAGSLYAPRLTMRRRNPLKVYAVLEVAIAVSALAILRALPLVERFYTAWGGEGAAGVLVRAVVTALCLLPPTFAMGATLPVIAKWLEITARRRAVGFFYAGNILGAVIGCLGAGFYLLRVYDMYVATYVAVAINVSIAIAAVICSTSSQTAFQVPGARVLPATSGLRPRTTGLLISIALSGFCALSAEVVWTRMLSLIFGATVYTFSIVLAVFLIGLGVGSAAGSVLGRRVESPANALGWCQWLSIAAMFWSAYMLAQVLPYRPVGPDAGALGTFAMSTWRALLAILPAPLCWGASFSLALIVRQSSFSNATEKTKPDAPHDVGRVYAANTVGAIAGALSTSLFLVSWVGSGHTQQLMMLAAAVAGTVMLWPVASSGTKALVAGAAVAAAALIFTVPPLPPLLVAYGRHAAAWVGRDSDVIYVGEGIHSSIAVSKGANGVLNYHNAGKIQASSEPQDMRLQRMLGHLTTLVPERPRSVLVIGCGAGVTAGAVSVNPAVERVTIVEIEPLVPKTAAAYFGGVNHDVLRNPKVHVIVDDARHFLMTTREKFDAITSDPLDPWVKGAATLYTREFFDTARAHLNPGGAMTLFVQLYESSPEAVKSEVATFFGAFPDGMIFGNTFDGSALDTVLVGPVSPPALDLDAIDRTLGDPAYGAVVRSLGEIGVHGAYDLFANYAGRARDLRGWTATAAINRDRNLRLQYLAGLGVNRHDGNRIYRDIVSYRTFPADLFAGSPTTLWSLRQAIEGARE